MATLDKMKIKILRDGTIKITTDPISGPNHLSAEEFVRKIGELAGGDTTFEKRHDHGHDHGHDYHQDYEEQK